ncbi:TetR/AcrR family transcriptional regulator [Cochlodiniinecator piscidefendens]|uniref:TetR/AcrR family transcriptional regulator n=1 Tax=Cochlodiniinecator piscidefendens TaxID=2715756 RepID=UPI00140C83CF|nr:TetR/AcrR family transcriptional regulator [Cochlodiniinecator piscidefendens]
MEQNSKGWRGSPDLWLDAAYDLLISGGVEAVKIQALAKAVGMSRPSFYWHFEHREAVLDALIARWESKNTTNLVVQTQKPSQSIEESIFHLFDCWLDVDLFDMRLDFAIRNWAQTSDVLKARLTEVDQMRMDALVQMFVRHGFDRDQAFARATTVYYTQVGYIAMMMKEPKTLRVERMPTYIETFTGKAPTQDEVSAFRARHL